MVRPTSEGENLKPSQISQPSVVPRGRLMDKAIEMAVGRWESLDGSSSMVVRRLQVEKVCDKDVDEGGEQEEYVEEDAEEEYDDDEEQEERDKTGVVGRWEP